jgi:tetratricopeptide (TPR) repeat protein
MTSLRGFLSVLACCLVLAVPVLSVAAADPAQGQAAFAEGQKLFVAGDYHGALTWFKNGYTQTEDAAFLLNIAQCHRFLGEDQAALRMFRLFLKSAPEGTSPQARAVATKAIKELESAPKAEPSATTAAPTNGPAAASPVVAPAPTPAAPEPAVLPASDSGPKFQSAPAGLPVLEPLPELDAPKAQTVAAKAATDTTAPVRHLRVAAMVCGAVGLITGGVGFYYWTRASALSDSANKATVYNKADYDDGKRAEKMQWIFYGVGGAAVATGVGLLVYSSLLPAPKRTNLSLAPMVGLGAAGFAARGTF